MKYKIKHDNVLYFMLLFRSIILVYHFIRISFYFIRRYWYHFFVLNVFANITSTFTIPFILSWKNKFLIDILHFLVYDINLAIAL
jgi:uncharacterized protein (DUF983 family)